MDNFRTTYLATATRETRKEAAELANGLRKLRFSGRKPSAQSVHNAVLLAFLPN